MMRFLYLAFVLLLSACVPELTEYNNLKGVEESEFAKDSRNEKCSYKDPQITLNVNVLDGSVLPDDMALIEVRLGNDTSTICNINRFRLLLEGLPSGAETTLPLEVDLPSGAQHDYPALIAIAPGTAAQTYSLKLMMMDSNDKAYRVETSFNIEVLANDPVCVRSAPSISVNPGTFNGLVGDSFTYSMTLQDNNQNCGDSLYALSYQVLPQGFGSNITNHTLASGQSITVTRTINTTGAAMGNHEFLLRAQDANAENFSASDAEFLVVLTEPDPIEEPAAPVLNSATYSSGNYVLTFSQPDGSLAPAGGYDTFINNVDLNDRDQYSGFSRTITGLDNQVEQCFKIQGRYTQLSPAEFPVSNEICVAAQAPTCVRANPSLAVSPSSFSGNAGDSFNFNVTLTNNDQNCANNTFALGYQNLPSGFSSNLPSTRTLAAGASTTFAVSMSVAESVAASNYSAVLSAANGQYSATKTLNFAIQSETTSPDDPNRAFPNAYGGGSVANANHGGVLVKVNTLNFNTPLTYHPANGNQDAYYTGGFNAAFESNIGSRYIVFDVSGVVQAPGGDCWSCAVAPPVYSDGHTVFGQSAPRGGITLYKSWIRYSRSNNIILRYLRVRSGIIQGTPITDDATTVPIQLGAQNSIVDHCSLSWGGDKGLIMGDWFDGYPLLNITASRNFVADSATQMFSVDGINSGAGDWDASDNISWIYNLSMGGHRTPNVGGGHGNFEIQNNVVQANGSRLSNVVYGNPIVNHVANYYDTKWTSVIKNKFQKIGGSTPSIYTAQNYYKNANGVLLTGTTQENNQTIWANFSGNSPVASQYFSNESYYGDIPNPAPLLSAQEAKDNVLADVGANKYLDDDGYPQTYQDNYDLAAFNDFQMGSFVFREYSTDWVLPTLPTNTRSASFDSDNDGMADAWEIREFGNLSQSYRGDFDNDGVLNINEYMNQVDQ